MAVIRSFEQNSNRTEEMKFNGQVSGGDHEVPPTTEGLERPYRNGKTPPPDLEARKSEEPRLEQHAPLTLAPNDIGYFRIPIYQHFKENNFFCVTENSGRWDFLKMAEDYRPFLMRQRLDYERRGNQKRKIQNVRVLLRPELGVFVFGQFDSMIIVYAETPEKARSVFDELRKKYHARQKQSRPKPCFHILSVGKRVETESVNIDKKYAQTPETLQLHYGDSLLDWEEKLVEKWLKTESGITILQGAPGTGKTCYLRHLVHRLCKQCLFYYLPQTSYSLLSSPNMVSFWAKQAEDNKRKKKVVIIEDAESILMKRAGDNREEVGNLLNISDGFLGNFMKMHILCTINTQMDDLDPALLRRGRLIGYREFARLTPEHARAIAEAKGLTLAEQTDYSLAEIYSSQHIWEGSTQEKRVGF